VFPVRYEHHLHIKSKTLRVTGCGGPWGSEMLRIPHYLENRLTDGSEVVSLTRRPHSTPQKKITSPILVLVSVRS
jgi:hypothetical protein